ncbi:hypothetical protein ACFPC0_10835 [Streptomyces andamanensis]|uniref:Uncharacterized protein n=1 Tax=Streptomyces andamanensis TaxID=1565035 RepID=A0ABV8TCF7_9ACTN
MQHWTGTLAYTDRPTRTGTTLAHPERLLTRPLPLPLFLNEMDGHPVGAVTTLSIHADEVRAEGTIRDGILTPGRPLPVGIDVIPEDADTSSGHALMRRWRIAAASVLNDPEHRAPAWPGTTIRLKGDSQ